MTTSLSTKVKAPGAGTGTAGAAGTGGGALTGGGAGGGVSSRSIRPGAAGDGMACAQADAARARVPRKTAAPSQRRGAVIGAWGKNKALLVWPLPQRQGATRPVEYGSTRPPSYASLTLRLPRFARQRRGRGKLDPSPQDRKSVV